MAVWLFKDILHVCFVFDCAFIFAFLQGFVYIFFHFEKKNVEEEKEEIRTKRKRIIL